MNIRDTLIKLRSDSNLSQQEFADLLDVSRQTVSRWEAGKSVPSSAQISKICKAFNLDANFLLSGTNAPNDAVEQEVRESEPESKAAEAGRQRKIKTVIIAVAAALMLIALAGLIVTIVYAVKDGIYDTVTTVWVVAIPQNTPMIILSVFLAIFIILLAAMLIFVIRGRKK